ncbi:hypothetical protein AVEN_182683-1, partial [Araneus ventricosus]
KTSSNIESCSPLSVMRINSCPLVAPDAHLSSFRLPSVEITNGRVFRFAVK